MAVPNRSGKTSISDSEQDVLNSGFDKDTGILAFIPLGFDGSTGLQRLNGDALATKITTVGSDTYIGIASPGTAQSTAKWQCKKISDNGSGTITFTWADGDSSFDNVATDLTALTYS